MANGPQPVKLVAQQLNRSAKYDLGVRTVRTPDLLIVGHWALDIKIARPFGDNRKLAENSSVNLLHPYGGNTSLLGDCLLSIWLGDRVTTRRTDFIRCISNA